MAFVLPAATFMPEVITVESPADTSPASFAAVAERTAISSASFHGQGEAMVSTPQRRFR